jgi:hypothetical protein
VPKGFLTLGMDVRASIIEQKTKKNNCVPVIQIERCKGVGITIYDHRVNVTIEIFNCLKMFCLVRGFDYCYEQQE